MKREISLIVRVQVIKTNKSGVQIDLKKKEFILLSSQLGSINQRFIFYSSTTSTSISFTPTNLFQSEL